MKKKSKFRKRELNTAAYEIAVMKYLHGPLWRNYYNEKYGKNRRFRPQYISR